MVNMRDYDNVQHLAHLAEELAGLGFGLRIDVGHGYDTVFPVRHDLAPRARLMGEVTLPGFEPVDLRGTAKPNMALLLLHYRAQKRNSSVPVIYAEQWHGNESRMLQSGSTPYNSLIKNMENIRAGEPVDQHLGLNDNLHYLRRVREQFGGQTISFFNSHDEESPTSNYQNMIWPTAAFLVFSSDGPLMYHISRLPDERVGQLPQAFRSGLSRMLETLGQQPFQASLAGRVSCPGGPAQPIPHAQGIWALPAESIQLCG